MRWSTTPPWYVFVYYCLLSSLTVVHFKLSQGANEGRTDDVRRVRGVTARLLNRLYNPTPAFDTENRVGRGFLNDICGQLMSPITVKWDDLECILCLPFNVPLTSLLGSVLRYVLSARTSRINTLFVAFARTLRVIPRRCGKVFCKALCLLRYMFD